MMQGDLTSIRFDGVMAYIPHSEIGAYTTLLAIAAADRVDTRPCGTGQETAVDFRDEAAARLVQGRLEAMFPAPTI